MRSANVEARRHQLYKVIKPSRCIKIYYTTASINVYAEDYVETCEINNFETLTTRADFHTLPRYLLVLDRIRHGVLITDHGGVYLPVSVRNEFGVVCAGQMQHAEHDLNGDIITVMTRTGNKTVILERGGVITNIINRLVSGST